MFVKGGEGARRYLIPKIMSVATPVSFLSSSFGTGQSFSASSRSSLSDVPFPFAPPPELSFGSFQTSLQDHGAVEGGEVCCTDAFALAMVACSERGGGTIVVPCGEWLTGPIHFRSHVRLHLEEGAVIRFSRRFSDYLPPVLTQIGGIWIYNYSALLYARGVEQIAITGSGMLDGQGEAWWPWKHLKTTAHRTPHDMMQSGTPLQERVFGAEEFGIRPDMVNFMDCRHVLIEGVTFRNSPRWTVHPVCCENFVVRHVSIYGDGPNTDGIDPDCCRNVLIEDCFMDTGDDCIAIKAGRDEDGLRYGRPTENVVIRRLTTRRGNGGIAIGSEISAGVRNVYVEDCSFSGTTRGIRIKTSPGRGGFVENVTIRRVTMRDIRDEAVIIHMDYGNPARGQAGWTAPSTTDTPTRIENIHLEEIHCENAGRNLDIAGDEALPPRGIVLRNVSLISRDEAVISGSVGLGMENVRLLPLHSSQ